MTATLPVVTRKHPLAKCEECPLADQAYVPSSPGRGVLIVGEAPGETEARQGRGFAGPSGKVLAHAIVAAGVVDDLRGAAVTNAVLCHPTANGHNVKPSARALACCAPRLEAEVVRATAVLALGNVAAKAVIGRPVRMRDDALSENTALDGTRVIVAPHPAAVLRDPGWWPELVGGAAQIARTKVTYEPAPEPLVPRSRWELSKALETVGVALTTDPSPLVVDIEATRPPEWWRTRPARLRCVGFAPVRPAADPRPIVVPEELCADPGVRDYLTGLFNHHGIVAHNAKFDVPAMAHHGIGARVAGDTMLGEVCVDERKGGKGLESISHRRLGAPVWKPVTGDKAEVTAWYDTVSDHELYLYNGVDLHNTRQVAMWQARNLGAEQWKLYEFLLQASDMLTDAESIGVLVSPRELRRRILSARVDYEEAELRLNGLNPRSPQQVRAALEALGEDLEDTKAITLKYLEGEAGELARRVLASREVRKLLSTYLEPLETLDSPDGRVHPNFHIPGTETGRLSCSRPNIQNQPKGMRDVFVAGEGNTFLQADFAQAELRVVAVIVAEETGDTSLLEVMRDPSRDLFGELATDVFGPHPGPIKKHPGRPLAKTVVHGTNYGRKAAGIAAGLHIPVSQAQSVYTRYLSAYPGIGRWHAQVQAQVRAGVAQTTPWGRVRRLPPAMGWMSNRTMADLHREALAFRPSSIASDINMTAAIQLHREGFKPSVLVHDSILLEVPTDSVDEGRQALQEATYAAGRTYTQLVDFPVDISTGQSWGEL